MGLIAKDIRRTWGWREARMQTPARLAVPALQLPRGLCWSEAKIVPLHEKPQPPFWHDDGDIFLRTSDDKYFRLHLRFFREQNKDFGLDLMVHQTLNFGDIAATSEVFQYLIEALYKPAWLAIHGSNFDVVVGLLRITTKYKMGVLRSDIITLLKKKVMPCDCTAMVERLNAVEKTPERPPFGVTFSPFKMIALAREVDLPELFPPVVYLLVRTLIRVGAKRRVFRWRSWKNPTSYA
ncbi:hypothetical protein JB92DRAFT_3144608 [Gautieria morchelliformis]|nr:hypothetical protein JB92DRAFT_3144608 [Gautieria morchelliformis]